MSKKSDVTVSTTGGQFAEPGTFELGSKKRIPSKPLIARTAKKSNVNFDSLKPALPSLAAVSVVLGLVGICSMDNKPLKSINIDLVKKGKNLAIDLSDASKGRPEQSLISVDANCLKVIEESSQPTYWSFYNGKNKITSDNWQTFPIEGGKVKVMSAIGTANIRDLKLQVFYNGRTSSILTVNPEKSREIKINFSGLSNQPK